MQKMPQAAAKAAACGISLFLVDFENNMVEKIVETTEEKKLIDDMFDAGSHFGYSKSRRHPSVRDFIFGTKNKVEIIDLEKTIRALEEAKDFVGKYAQEGKQILFVGSKPEARKWIAESAASLDMPYVSERWIGGTLTNFPEIKKRVARLQELTEKKEKGELAMYTKKERLLLDREVDKLNKNFGGITLMRDLPKALFIIDPKAESNAVEEAKKEGIPIIALASSDCDISQIDYPIPANDASSPSIKLFVEEIAAAYKKGRESKPEVVEKSESEVKEDTKKED